MICMGKAFLKSQSSRSAIQKRLVLFRKKSCEQCGTSKNLGIHHKDKNWMNNEESNLMTLCSSCHTSLHHSMGDIVQKTTKQPCIICGKRSYRQALCCTHLTRLRRYGNPLMKKIKHGKSWLVCLDSSGLSGQTLQELQIKYPEGWTDLGD